MSEWILDGCVYLIVFMPYAFILFGYIRGRGKVLASEQFIKNLAHNAAKEHGEVIRLSKAILKHKLEVKLDLEGEYQADSIDKQLWESIKDYEQKIEENSEKLAKWLREEEQDD